MTDLVEGDSAFCQPDETLLTEALTFFFRWMTKMHSHRQRGHYLFYYTEQKRSVLKLVLFYIIFYRQYISNYALILLFVRTHTTPQCDSAHVRVTLPRDSKKVSSDVTIGDIVNKSREV